MLVRAARFFRGFVRVSSADHRARRCGGAIRFGTSSTATHVVTSSLLAILIGLTVLLPVAGALADSTSEQPAAEQSDREAAAKDANKTSDGKDEPTADKPAKQSAEQPVEQPAEQEAKADSPEKKEPAKKKSFLSTLIKSATGDKVADDKAAGDKKSSEEKMCEKPTDEPTSKTIPAGVKVEVKVEVKPSAKDSRAKASDKKPAPAKKTATVARLRLAGSYPETPETASPFGAASRSLASLLNKFDELAEDKNVAAVLLEIETPDLGGGKLHEIRQAIARYRASGKPIYAVLTSADATQYVLASACDEIIMPPPGVLLIPGVRAEVTFYKGLFDKLGVQFDVLAMGKYKGAGEPYSRTSMSKPLRESLEALVDHRYEWFVETVADDRKLEDYEVKTLIDRAMFTAQKAKKAGLVDRVAYVDAFVEQLPKRLKADDVKLVSAYEKKTQEIDLSGIGGMMKLMQMIMGADKPKAAPAGKKIAVVYAVGSIAEGKSAESLLGGSVLGSTTLVEALQKADEDPDVVAIVLRVESPGGSAVASDLIWRETQRIDKPIIASMGDVAASGGYYISMGTDKIFAEPGTVTGSIGVIGGKFVLGGLYRKLGLTTEIISRGKNSGAMTSEEPFTPEERAIWTEMLQDIYRQFVSKAAKGRDMSYAELHKLAQGRVYCGQTAKELGLIDEIGTLHDAVAAAKEAAGLDADEKVQLLILPRPRSFFEQLFEDPSAATDAVVRAAGPVAEYLGQTAVFQRLFNEPVLMWMPYRIELK